MRVVHLLGVFCAVAATAYGQDEDDTIYGQVVYTPHNRTNLIISTRSVGEDPGPDDDDKNYGRIVTRPSDHMYPSIESNLDLVRRMKGRRPPIDDEEEYGKVIYSPSERTQPESGGKFTELRETMRRGEGDSNNVPDGENDFGKVIFTPGEGQPKIDPIGAIREILRQGANEEWHNGPVDMSTVYEDAKRIMEEMRLSKGEGQDGTGQESGSQEQYSPETINFAAQNAAALFNDFIKMATLTPDGPLKVDEKYTGMMDSVLQVGNDINGVAGRFDRSKRSIEDDGDYYGEYENPHDEDPRLRHDVVNKRSAEEPLHPELELRDVRRKRSAEEPLHPELELRDVRRKRSAEEPLHPELELRDVRRKRSADGLSNLLDNHESRTNNDRQKRGGLNYFLLSHDMYHDMMNTPDDDFRSIVDIRKRRMVDDPTHRDDQVEKERAGVARFMADDPNHRDDQVEKERIGTARFIADDPNHRDDQVEKERIGTARFIADDPNHRDDQVEKERIRSARFIADDPNHRDDQVEKERIGRRRRRMADEPVERTLSIFDHENKHSIGKWLQMFREKFHDLINGKNSDFLNIVDIRRKRMVDDPTHRDDQVEKERISRMRRSDDDDDDVTTQPPRVHSALDRMQMSKRSIIEEDLPLPPFDNTETSDIMNSGDLGTRQERSIIDENIPLPPFDDTETSDITRSGDLGMRRERSAGHETDSVSTENSERQTSAEERESFFVPVQLHETGITNSRYVPVDSQEIDVDYVHSKEGRIQVQRNDEEVEAADAKSEVLNRARRSSDVRPDIDGFGELHSTKDKLIPTDDSLPLPTIDALDEISPAEYIPDVEPAGVNMDGINFGLFNTDAYHIVADRFLHKPIHSVVETKEVRGHPYDRFNLEKAANIKRSVDHSTDTVETHIRQPNGAPMIIVERSVRQPIHPVIERVDTPDDSHANPINKEYRYVKGHPDVGEYETPDVTQHVYKPNHSVDDEYLTPLEETGSSNVVVTSGGRNSDIDIITELHTTDLSGMGAESTRTRVNDKEMSTDDLDTRVATISTSAPETSVPVTETTVHVTETSVPVTESTVHVTETSVPVTESTVHVTETSVPVTESTVHVTETSVPVTESTVHVTETSVPVTESTVHVTETSVPVTESTVHVTETSATVTETSVPVTHSTVPDTTVFVTETTVVPKTDEHISDPYGLRVHLPIPFVDEDLRGHPSTRSTETTPTTLTPTDETIICDTSPPTTVTTTEVTEKPKISFERRIKNLLPIVEVLTEDALRARKTTVDPRDSRGPHLFPDVAPTQTPTVPEIDSDRIVPPIGFEAIPDYKRRESTSVIGPTFTDHPVVSIVDVHADGITDDYDDTGVSGGKRVVPHSKNHGGYDKNHGGYDDKHIDCDDDYDGGFGKDHGGYDKNRGGYGKNRGGYGKNRGGYDKHRGGYDDHHGHDYDDDHHGGYDDHHGHDYDDDNDSGYDDHHGHHGGYDHHGHDYDDEDHSGYDYHDDCDDDFGGYNKNRGGYGKNRGGYNKHRGGYEKNRGGYNKNRGGYDRYDPDCSDEVDIYEKIRGGYNKNRGGYNKNRGGYNKNRGGYDKDWDVQVIQIDDCDQDEDFGGYNKNRGGYGKTRGGSKNSGGYKNRGGNKNRGGYVTIDCDDDYTDFQKKDGGYKKNGGGYKKNGGGYKKNRDGYKSQGRYTKNRAGSAQHRGYISKFDDPYVEYEAGHHGGPGDMHLQPRTAHYRVGLAKRSANGQVKREIDVRRAKIPGIGLLNAPGYIAEPEALSPDVTIPKFQPPMPLLPEERRRSQIGDVNKPGFGEESNPSFPEVLPDKFLKPLQRPDWSEHPFKPKSQLPHARPPIFENQMEDKETDVDKGAYWHKLEIPIFGFEHEAQIQPIHKLRHLIFPKPQDSKKDETFTRMKLGPWSMRFGLDL